MFFRIGRPGRGAASVARATATPLEAAAARGVFRATFVAVTAAAVLVACGGGGDGGSSGPNTTAVKVVGDSLNDSGTFGLKFTVQGSASDPSQIWTDRVASAVSVPALCPRYQATGPSTVALNPAATGCTSYGVGGARINPVGSVNDATPVSVIQQLKDIAAQQPRYNPEELLLVDGGGNDFADLVTLYLYAAVDSGVAFSTLIGELLSAAEAAPGGTPHAPEVLGMLYSIKLADILANAVQAEALDRDAQRIAVLTAPDITRTPRFLALLAQVEAAVNTGGGNGALAVAQLKGMVAQWVTGFNQQLKNRFAGNSRVVVVDFFAAFNNWLDTPATYGLTNATKPACPQTGVDSDGLPTYNIAACSAASLSASPPVGETGPDWWKSYVFSDNFHGTPRTNELMGNLVVQALEAKGWK